MVYICQQHNAKVFFQVAPFWEDRFPKLHVWQCDALRPYVESGTYDRWSKLQRTFCATATGAIERLTGPLVNLPSYSMGNWWLKNKASRQHLANGFH